MDGDVEEEGEEKEEKESGDGEEGDEAEEEDEDEEEEDEEEEDADSADRSKEKFLRALVYDEAIDREVYRYAMEKDFSIFKKGQTYSYVEDLKEAYSETLSKSKADQIFDSLPVHVFMDIKKPLKETPKQVVAKHNPFRAYEFATFFEHREWLEYLHEREKQTNTFSAKSAYRQY